MIVSTIIFSALFINLITALPLPKNQSSAAFIQDNGRTAQANNARFQTLTSKSSCQDGEVACVDQNLALCVGGTFQIQPCGAGLICVDLPLVLSRGTSVTCDTEQDALARIAATGVDGGLLGNGGNSTNVQDLTANGNDGGNGDIAQNTTVGGSPSQCHRGKRGRSRHNCTQDANANNSSDTVTVTVTQTADAKAAGATSTVDSPANPTANPTADSGANIIQSAPDATQTSSISSTANFRRQNGLDAQNLNASFAKLTADSPCQTGDLACLNQGFAQCVNGKFVVTPCTTGTQCMALPLVNKPGTTVTCDRLDDGLARFAASGVSSSLDGSSK